MVTRGVEYYFTARKSKTPRTATWPPAMTSLILYGARVTLLTVNLGMAPPHYGQIQSIVTRPQNDPSILRVHMCVNRKGEGERKEMPMVGLATITRLI